MNVISQVIARLTKYYKTVPRWRISTLLVIKSGKVLPVLVWRGISKLIKLVLSDMIMWDEVGEPFKVRFGSGWTYE